jgi:hypothetical protein
MDGISCLREAISTVPVPGAPPRLSHDGAVVGLAFLDGALRLNHVRRLTERLSLIEHRIARRTTEVDINLNMLDRGQSAAAKLFQQFVSHTLADSGPRSIHDNTIWVPVARISRRTAEPIDVRDASGNKVPRLTQYETSRLMVSGLYRLLRESLTSHPDSSNPDTDLSHILFKVHEPRWLIQAALLTLFTERNRPDAPTTRKVTPGTVDGHVRQYRTLALGIFDQYAHYLKDYSALLDVALNEHLLVVALDATTDEHLLTYDTPLYVNERPPSLRRIERALRASGEGYYVQYHTNFPSTLRSYHLIFECGSDVDISHIYLSTDADAKTVESLELDLAHVADRLASQRQTPAGESARKLLELETQTALRKVAEIVRRRRWEASHADITLPEQYLRASYELTQAAVAGEATRDAYDKANNSILTHPSISPENLRAAAAELAALDMSYDLSLESDPVTNRAHVYWRRAPEHSVNAGQIHIRAGAILREATGDGPRDALLYAGVLAGTAYLMACFLSRSIWPYGNAILVPAHSIRNAEAVIGVLLVVPGFLYTRLTIPDPHSISGHLRAVPRIVVRVCISSMVVVAAAIAAASDAHVTRIAFIFATLLPLLSTPFLLRRRPYDLKKALGRMGAPKWAGGYKPGRLKAAAPDVRFFSSGGSHE